MPSPERRWRDPKTTEQPKGDEVLQPPVPLGIFIDDENTFAKGWERCFKIPGFATLRPEIPDMLDEETEDEIGGKIIQFINGITDDQLKMAAVVVVDQFYDQPDLRVAMTRFISRLRKINQQAFILETSGDPDGLIYPESNAVITTGMWHTDAQQLIRKSPSFPLARLQALRIYSNPAFIQASLADPRNDDKYGRFEAESAREYSCKRLIARAEFGEIIKMLETDVDTPFLQIFEDMSPEQQKLFLHNGWNIVGHIQIGNGPAFFGGSVERLRGLLNK